MSNRTEYEKNNTIGVYLKLNKKTDRDIIEALGTCSNKQGYIKALIREDLKQKLGAETIRHFN